MLGRLFLTLLGVLLLSLAPAPVLAGGWAVTTLDTIPAELEAGRVYTIGYTIRQHGERPFPDAKTSITIVASDGQRHVFPARPEGPPGHYVAEVRFPTPGAWQWEVDQSPFARQPLGTIVVVPAAAAAVAPAAVAAVAPAAVAAVAPATGAAVAPTAASAVTPATGAAVAPAPDAAVAPAAASAIAPEAASAVAPAAASAVATRAASTQPSLAPTPLPTPLLAGALGAGAALAIWLAAVARRTRPPTGADLGPAGAGK